jgi:hypothetical protein
LEVTVLKGRGADVQELADHVIAERGVRHAITDYDVLGSHFSMTCRATSGDPGVPMPLEKQRLLH